MNRSRQILQDSRSSGVPSRITNRIRRRLTASRNIRRMKRPRRFYAVEQTFQPPLNQRSGTMPLPEHRRAVTKRNGFSPSSVICCARRSPTVVGPASREKTFRRAAVRRYFTCIHVRRAQKRTHEVTSAMAMAGTDFDLWIGNIFLDDGRAFFFARLPTRRDAQRFRTL